jgi:CheY-like chemotaxis protein
MGRVLNVLLVDDNPINLRILTKYLEGHNVTTAANGPDALESFRRQYFSIVFLDIVLPNDVSGVDVANRMNEIQVERGRAPVPIVAVTGHKVEDYAPNALKAGIKEFLTKPVSKTALLNLLVKYCGEDRG